MPPKKPPKKKKDSVVRIDAHKHDEAIKDIEEARLREKEAEEEMLELLMEEEEMSEEEQSEEEIEFSDIETPFDVGRIDLSFPEATDKFDESDFCYPPSYYTLSSKERLLLLYAENFRKQFVINNTKRRALVLAIPNECNIQKFVCTTIRPTAFVHLPLICNEQEIASFVADFITYEPLEEVTELPPYIVSPATLLLRRRGNCFEMANLLCSMLIGAGFPAMVVSGIAREPIVLNDQTNVPYPHPIHEIKAEEDAPPKEVIGQKYKLRAIPDLESHLEEHIAEILRLKAEAEEEKRMEIIRKEKEELEMRAVDRNHFRRRHAWVVILDNAPWSIKPRITYTKEDGEIAEMPPTPRFIEPSTGFYCESRCKQYIAIDSVWNNHNYYVNRQSYQRIDEIRWDLTNTADWEHVLPGEPPEMRVHGVGASDENVIDTDYPVEEEKHLDTIRSWGMKPHIGRKVFEQRFPKLYKIIKYKRAIHTRFSPYTRRDGKIMELTMYADDEYKEPETLWVYFDHRSDLLKQIKYTYATGQTEEFFDKVRDDCLRFMEYNIDSSKPKRLYFYSASRLDSLKFLEVETQTITLHYSNRSDNCYYQKFEFKPAGQNILKVITEKFHRNNALPANKDIAVRTTMLAMQKILLKFHYARGALTASTREFIKPPKPDYGQELKFDPTLTKGYKANVTDPDPTPLELYKLLLEQLQAGEKIQKRFEKITDEINAILDLRRHEMENPMLTFDVFDPLRNGAARAIRMKQYEEAEAHKREVAMKPPDFLAPYLVPYKGRELTYDESWAAYNACLNDLKTRFVGLLNDLQRQYEDLTSESKALTHFLQKFEDQFDNYNYNRLVQEAKDIELNKSMVQQRLTLTHEGSQKKYESVKESLLKDPRLNLTKDDEENDPDTED